MVIARRLNQLHSKVGQSSMRSHCAQDCTGNLPTKKPSETKPPNPTTGANTPTPAPIHLHSRKQTWNLRMAPWTVFLLQTSGFPGPMLVLHGVIHHLHPRTPNAMVPSTVMFSSSRSSSVTPFSLSAKRPSLHSVKPAFVKEGPTSVRRNFRLAC